MGSMFGAATGTIFNEPGAFIAGDNGVTVHANVSMINFGSITGMGDDQAGFLISDRFDGDCPRQPRLYLRRRGRCA